MCVWMCVSAPSNQSAHTRQGCGSLRRRVQSECRVLARLEASPVTGLLGMERKRQGSTLLALVLAHPGVAGLWPGVQACHSRRARLARGGKVHFVIRCFKTRLRRHPSHASWPPTHPPRCWVCHGPGTYRHGVTHATVTHSAVSPPASSGPSWGPASHLNLTATTAQLLTTHLLHLALSGCTGALRPASNPGDKVNSMGNLGTNHVH